MLALHKNFDIGMIRAQMAGPAGFGLTRVGFRECVPLMAYRTGSDGTVRIAGADSAGPGFIDGLVVRAQFNGGAVTGLTAGSTRGPFNVGRFFWSAPGPSKFLLGHKTAALVIELKFAEAGSFGTRHRAAGQFGMSAFEKLLHFLGMTAGAGFGRDHGRDIGIGAFDTLTLAGHGRIFCHHMAVIAGNAGMAHAAGSPALHDTGHFFGMAFDAAQSLLGEASFNNKFLLS